MNGEEPRYHVRGTCVFDRAGSAEMSVASFRGAELAEAYAAWLNAGAPLPKFKVGDRVVDRSNPHRPGTIDNRVFMHHVAWDVADHYHTSTGTYLESSLELAPPEPRAKVIHPHPAEDFYVECDGQAGTWKHFKSKKLAESVAALLNEHPDWPL